MTAGIKKYPHICLLDRCLSNEENRRTNIKKRIGTTIPPVISSFENKTLSDIVVAALSKISQKDERAEAIIRIVTSTAPLTSLFCQARKAPKKATNEVTR